MEESYQFAVRRETLHNIHSYSYELEHLISGHSDAFQGKSWDKGAKLAGLDGITWNTQLLMMDRKEMFGFCGGGVVIWLSGPTA